MFSLESIYTQITKFNQQFVFIYIHAHIHIHTYVHVYVLCNKCNQRRSGYELECEGWKDVQEGWEEWKGVAKWCSIWIKTLEIKRGRNSGHLSIYLQWLKLYEHQAIITIKKNNLEIAMFSYWQLIDYVGIVYETKSNHF